MDIISDYESIRTIDSVIDTETGEEIAITNDFFKQEEATLMFLRRRQYEAAYLGIGTPKYICSYCRKAVVLLGKKTQRGHVGFFAHYKDSDECPIKTRSNISKEMIDALNYKEQAESDRHIELKSFIAKALQCSTYNGQCFKNIQIEKYIKSEIDFFNWAKPDVYAETNDLKINFEVQVSTTFLSVLITRDIFYRYHNVFILWVFNFDENQRYMDESSLMTKDIFYANNGNMFILDQISRQKTEEQRELVFLCKWIEPSLNENGVIEKNINEKYVSVSELTFDHKTHTIYYFDSITALSKYDSSILQIRQEMEWNKLAWIDELRIHIDGEIPTQDEVIERIKDGTYVPYWIKKGNKYGWSKFGYSIIQYIYNQVEPFDRGFAIVKRNRKFGIIDLLGNETIPCSYKSIKRRSNLTLSVRNDDGRFGIMSVHGAVIIPCDYCYIWNPIEGMSKVNKEGTIAEGKIVGGKYGFVNFKTKQEIPCIYDFVTDFCNGLAKVKVITKLKGFNVQWGVINKDGEIEIQTNGGSIFIKYNMAWDCQDGLIKVLYSNKYGFLNEHGVEVIPIKYDLVDEFKEDFLKVKIGQLYGYVNKQGIEVISVKYEWVGEFVESHLLVKFDEKYGYVNKNGEEIIPICYNYAWNFQSGVAKVGYKFGNNSFGYKWVYGFIDTKGNPFIPCDYEWTDDYFMKDIIRAQKSKNGKYFYLDIKGCKRSKKDYLKENAL